MNANDKSRRALLQASIATLVFGPITGCVTFGQEFSRGPTQTSEQEELPRLFFRALADTIIPETDSPSGSAVDADLFALRVVTEARGAGINERFFRGARTVANESFKLFTAPFETLTEDQRLDYLRTVLARDDQDSAHWFLSRFRQLVLIGWVLSEEVAKQSFNYQASIYRYLPSTTNNKILLQSHLDRLYPYI